MRKEFNMEKLIDHIISNIGGKDNIDKAWNCMTRIRFNVKDDKKVKLNEIEKHPEVMGVRFQNGQHQVILGNKAASVFKEMEPKLGLTEGNSVRSNKKFNLGSIIDVISGLFTPILPAIVGTGLLKAILSLVVLFAPTAVESGAYQVFEIISDASFYFLPF